MICINSMEEYARLGRAFNQELLFVKISMVRLLQGLLSPLVKGIIPPSPPKKSVFWTRAGH
jgi:hypothetical protein